MWNLKSCGLSISNLDAVLLSVFSAMSAKLSWNVTRWNLYLNRSDAGHLNAIRTWSDSFQQRPKYYGTYTEQGTFSLKRMSKSLCELSLMDYFKAGRVPRISAYSWVFCWIFFSFSSCSFSSASSWLSILFFLFSSPASPHSRKIFPYFLFAFAPKSLSDVACESMFRTGNLLVEDWLFIPWV